MNTEMYKKLYEELKELLLSDSSNKTYIYRTPPKTAPFPKFVVFYEITNQYGEETLDGTQGYDLIGYEIRIVCSFKDSERNVDEAYSIAKIVDKFMESKDFNRMSYTTIPNVDGTIYNIILRYTAKISLNRGTII